MLQTDVEREARLKQTEETLQVEDEHKGGQLNANWQIEQERKEQQRLAKLQAAQPAGPQLTVPEPATASATTVSILR